MTANEVIKTIVSVLLVLGFLLMAPILLLILAFSGVSGAMLLVFFICYCDVLFVLQLLLWNRALLGRMLYIPILIACGGLVIGGISLGMSLYDDSIPQIREQGIDLQLYQPFTGSQRLARLDEPAALQLTGELPRMDCATALYPVAAAIVEAAYPEGTYAPRDRESLLYQTDTGTAYQRLLRGEVDVILVAGPSGQQLQMFAEQGIELQFTPIGREAFVFFVNRRNQVEDLTLEQIQGIYSGQITNWSEVGGKNDEIRAYQRNEGSGSQTALLGVMGDIPLMQAPAEEIVTAMGPMIREAADYKNYRGALGFSFRYYCTEMVDNGQIRLLSIGGVYPDRESIRSDSYPLSSQFYAVTARQGNDNVARLLDWICSPQGQELIERTGYVGL